jgi:CRP/FNR family transcriptional regulator
VRNTVATAPDLAHRDPLPQLVTDRGILGEARRELGAYATARGRPKQPPLRRGDAVDGLYLVVGGTLRVYYVTAEGREATLYDVEPGGTCILALTSTFAAEPYPAWVDAGTDGVSYVRLPGAVARRWLATEPAFRDFVFGVLAGRVLGLMQTLEETGSALVEQRVARYLIRHADPGGIVRVTQAGIAAELGSAREVVFRALRTLAERGLVRTGRGRVAVLDADGLRACARSASRNE